MNRAVTRVLTVASVLLVAAVAAVVSYSHMHTLAARAGEEWRAVLIPLSVDGLLLASTLAIVDRRRVRQPAGWVPWTGLTLGLVASLAANVAAAQPTLIAQLVAAWPPAALAIAIETLVIVLRGTAQGGETAPTPDHLAGARKVMVDQGSEIARTPTVGQRPTVTFPAPGKSLDATDLGERDPLTSASCKSRSSSTDSRGPFSPTSGLSTVETPGDDLVARARDLAAAGAGRGTLAKELELTESQARTLLAKVRSNGQVAR